MHDVGFSRCVEPGVHGSDFFYGGDAFEVFVFGEDVGAGLVEVVGEFLFELLVFFEEG